MIISIHALVKRATTLNIIGDILPYISIHALVKRATCGNFVKIRHANDFNPRPREEGDLKGDKNFNVPRDFNPRPREEGDKYKVLFTIDV